ncbi:MAG: porin [Methylococcales bacterium]|nr:porin [Methylococcales bacterium]MBT7445903.1 porin [Methylococcales bacterium]
MNKQRIAVFAALFFFSGLSQAKVKTYGSVQAEYTIEDRDGLSSEQGVDDNLRSKLGFKVTEKIGRGFKAAAVIEVQVNSAGDRGVNNRQMWVGLSHKKLGFLGAGALHSPYKNSGAKIDPFWFTALESRGAGGMSTAVGSANRNVNGGVNGILGHTGFIQSGLFYRSPAFFHTRLEIGLSPDEKANGVVDGESAGSSDGDDNDYIIALTYEKDDLWLFATYAKNNVENVDDEVAYKIAAQYKWGQHTFTAQREWVKNAFALDGGRLITGSADDNFSSVATGKDGKFWFLGYQYKLGNNIFVVQAGENDSEIDSDYYAVGMIHKFSALTKMFAGFTASENSPLRDRQAFSIGLRKDF